MIGEFLFALVRIGIYFFIFYFFYKIVGGVFRVLRGNDLKRSPGQPEQPPRPPVRKYDDVEDAKFKDLPPDDKP